MKSARWLLSVLLALTIPVGAWGGDVELDPVDDFYLWSVSNAEGAPADAFERRSRRPSVSWVKPSHGDHFQLPIRYHSSPSPWIPTACWTLSSSWPTGSWWARPGWILSALSEPAHLSHGPCILPRWEPPDIRSNGCVRSRASMNWWPGRFVQTGPWRRRLPLASRLGRSIPRRWSGSRPSRAARLRVGCGMMAHGTSFPSGSIGRATPNRNLQVFYRLKGEAIPRCRLPGVSRPNFLSSGVEAQEVRYEVLEDFSARGRGIPGFVLDPSPTMGPASPLRSGSQSRPPRVSLRIQDRDSGGDGPNPTALCAGRGPPQSREFLLNRTGDLSQALSVNFEVRDCRTASDLPTGAEPV